MDKDYYIGIVSKNSNRYGDKLVELMEKYDKNSLMEITLDEIRQFCFDKRFI